MPKKRVLFICVHNSARSQMAEALLNQMAGDRFEAQSAGIEPGELNPLAVEALKEIGIDISRNKTKSVFDFYGLGKRYDYVVTVCDESQSGKCPAFPGDSQRLHWSFDDPAAFAGSREEKLAKTREVRDKIRERIVRFLN